MHSASNPHRRLVHTVAYAWAAALVPAAAQASINFGQIDTFQDGSPAGWQQGVISPHEPTVVMTGGPDGAGDAYLQNVSSGGFGSGSKQVMFNQAQWAGNYTAAGVTRITGEMADFGPNPLSMRIALEDGTGSFSRFSSIMAISLPADGQWHPVTFDLTPSSLTLVSGTDSVSTALGNVMLLRILSASAGPSYNGDDIAATLGVADLRAMTVPGDLNHDGTVNFSDVLSLIQHYGQANATWEQGDVNFDGTVNFSDVLALIQNYGQSVSAIAAPAAAPAPEPTLLLPLLSIPLARKRRK